MPPYDDINELLDVARSINEGDYKSVSIDIDPESELFELASYFSGALKALKTIHGAVEDSIEDLPSFEKIINDVINDSKEASENVLTCVDKINFNINDIQENMDLLRSAVEKGDFGKCGGLIDRLRDKAVSGQDVSFDIIASLEFQDISKQKIDKLVKIIYDLQERLTHLVIMLGIKEKKIDSQVLDKYKEKDDLLQDQNLVNELLKEFGM